VRTDHGAFVDSWLKRRARTASAPALAAEALGAGWARAQRSLSELALQALARCALDAAAKEFPLLAEVRVTPRGFELGAGVDTPDLLAALRALLIELLALVEDTSGAILAPALEAELLRVGRTPYGLKPVPPG
jgi:hypothetical protein